MHRCICFSLCPDRYFGAGTVDTIKCHLNAVESQVRRFFRYYYFLSVWDYYIAYEYGVVNVTLLCQQGGVDAVFVNTILSGIQQRNLEASCPCPISLSFRADLMQL